MIEWQLAEYKKPKQKKLWGVTSARSKPDVRDCFREQWIQLFATILPSYESRNWNSLNCHVAVDNGTVDISPVLDFDRLKEMPGCQLLFTSLRDKVQKFEGSDAAYSKECQRLTAMYSKLLLEGWRRASNNENVTELLNKKAIPFHVLNVLDGRKVLHEGELA